MPLKEHILTSSFGMASAMDVETECPWIYAPIGSLYSNWPTLSWMSGVPDMIDERRNLERVMEEKSNSWEWMR